MTKLDEQELHGFRLMGIDPAEAKNLPKLGSKTGTKYDKKKVKTPKEDEDKEL